jgi:hypothetical protein
MPDARAGFGVQHGNAQTAAILLLYRRYALLRGLQRHHGRRGGVRPGQRKECRSTSEGGTAGYGNGHSDLQIEAGVLDRRMRGADPGQAVERLLSRNRSA